MHETVLVTGVNGFLGQYIVREFVARKSRVAAVSRSPILETAPWTNSISDLLVTDLCSPQFEATLVAVKPDLIIHAAGPSSVAESVKDPTSDFLGSVDVFYHVMDSVRRLAPSCKVLLLSSAAVYGNPQTLPVHEDAPLCPISPYGFHKKICEILIEEFHSIYGIRGCSVRIFSAYGAGLKRQVLWDISRKALWDKVVNLQGTGEETRDFVHAEDVARGLGIVADHAAFCAEAYNLSYGSQLRFAKWPRH